MEVSRDTDAYKSSNFHFLKSLFNFHSQKSTLFIQLPAFYLVRPWPTTLQKPWTNWLWLAPTIWTLARVKTATQIAFNLQRIMIFSVSSDGIQWTLDFGPDSVTLAVSDLDQNITISSQEIPLAAWQLLLAQRQDFLNNHLARVPITPNQEGTMEMRDEVLSSVGAQDLDTSSYQVSDLEDIDFNWENSQLDMDLVFQTGIDTPFLQQYLTIY